MGKENLSESGEAKIKELLQQWEEARPFFDNLDKLIGIINEAKEEGIELELYKNLLKLYMSERNETF